LRLVLLQRGDRILPELTEGLGAFAYKLLMKRGVDIHSIRTNAVSADAVVVEDAKTKETRVIKTRHDGGHRPGGAASVANIAFGGRRNAANQVDKGWKFSITASVGRWVIARW